MKASDSKKPLPHTPGSEQALKCDELIKQNIIIVCKLGPRDPQVAAFGILPRRLRFDQNTNPWEVGMAGVGGSGGGKMETTVLEQQ